MELTAQTEGRVRQALREHDPLSVARYMATLQLGGPEPPGTEKINALARSMGWIEPAGQRLTSEGWAAADSFREYMFWRERDRELPFAKAAPDIVSQLLSGRSVLEIGSGSGINLMSLARLGTAAIGIEPIEAYRQMGAIFAEVEGLESIRAVAGAAERIPFESDKFDTVLCVSSHQYFDIQPALQEIYRVLRPGGEVLLISGSWSRFLFGQAHSLMGGAGSAKGYVITIVNTAAYMLLGRRLIFRRKKVSTSYPVYPSRRAMRSLLQKAGFDLAVPPQPLEGEVFFRARKPVRS